jgi:transposase-like protein
MARKPSPNSPRCPRCGAGHVVRNGSKGGRPPWVCRGCGRSFGPTLGTAIYWLRHPPAEVVRTLLVVMRRGSLSAAEEVTGHKYETIGRWLRGAAQHAQSLSEALVGDLQLSAVEVDAFWSFVKRSAQRLEKGRVRQGGGPALGGLEPGPADAVGGGLGLCPSRGWGGAWGGGPDPPANAVWAGRALDQPRPEGLPPGGRSGLSGAPPLREAGEAASWGHPRRGADPGVQASSAWEGGQGRGPPGAGGTAVLSVSGHVERLNGGLRDRLGRLTGKSHAFAKQASTWDAAVTLCLFEHNWLRPLGPCGSRPLRTRAAGATGSAVQPWPWA